MKPLLCLFLVQAAFAQGDPISNNPPIPIPTSNPNPPSPNPPNPPNPVIIVMTTVAPSVPKETLDPRPPTITKTSTTSTTQIVSKISSVPTTSRSGATQSPTSNNGIQQLYASGSFPFNAAGYTLVAVVVFILLALLIGACLMKRRSRRNRNDQRFQDLYQRKNSSGSNGSLNQQRYTAQKTAGATRFESREPSMVSMIPPVPLHYSDHKYSQGGSWDQTVKGPSMADVQRGNSTRYSDLFDENEYLPENNTLIRDYGQFHN